MEMGQAESQLHIKTARRTIRQFLVGSAKHCCRAARFRRPGNLAGSFGGWPYLTISKFVFSPQQAFPHISPNQSITLSLQFSGPENASISFIPLVYSGRF